MRCTLSIIDHTKCKDTNMCKADPAGFMHETATTRCKFDAIPDTPFCEKHTEELRKLGKDVKLVRHDSENRRNQSSK